MGKLDAKCAIVTGGASGIGLATAHLLAGEGALRLAICDNEPGAGDRLDAAGDAGQPFDKRTV